MNSKKCILFTTVVSLLTVEAQASSKIIDDDIINENLGQKNKLNEQANHIAAGDWQDNEYESEWVNDFDISLLKKSNIKGLDNLKDD